jgi:hypothetical protein
MENNPHVTHQHKFTYKRKFNKKDFMTSTGTMLSSGQNGDEVMAAFISWCEKIALTELEALHKSSLTSRHKFNNKAFLEVYECELLDYVDMEDGTIIEIYECTQIQ